MNLLCCLGAWLLVCAGAADASDASTSESLAERFGTGMASPFKRREIVRSTMESCSKSFPEMKAQARATLVTWTQRQSGFLAVADVLREAAAAKAEKSKDPKIAAEWRKLVMEVLPRQIDVVGRTAAMSLDEGAADIEAKRGTCRELMSKVASGAADLDRWDPVNAKYLRDFAGKNFREGKPAANIGTSGLPAGASTRTDAAVLIGHWTVVRSTSYLLNGTVAQDVAGACSFEFTADKLVFECGPAGRKVSVVYTYRVVAAGRFEAEIVENQGRPDTIGTRSDSTFHVEGDDLFTVGFPSTSSQAPEKSALLLESISHREGRE
jgi:hypothetical protein